MAVALTSPRSNSRTPPVKALALLARLFKRKHAPLIALCLVLAFSVAGKAIDIGQPPCKAPCATHSKYTFIFDEDYYVNAARVIAGINPPQGVPYHDAPAGDDPNAEHPQLAKIVIAGTIKLFGDTAVGWRIGSIVFAAIALLALYALITGAGGSAWLAVGVCAVMSLDNLMLVHGRIATLDIYAVALMIVAAALYVRKHPLLAGLALGVATCMKEVALLLIIVFALFELLRATRAYRSDTAEAAGGPSPEADVGIEPHISVRHDVGPEPSTGAETHISEDDVMRPSAVEPSGWERLARPPQPSSSGPLAASAAYGALGTQAHRRARSRVVRARQALRASRRNGASFGLFVLAAAASFVGLLWLLDVLVPAYDPGTHTLYAGNPFSHIAHMYDYAQLLKAKPQETGIASDPLSWLLDAKTINYAKVAVNTLVGGKIIASHALVNFRGAINPFIILLAIPATFAALALAFRDSDDVAALGACWCLGAYLPLLFGNILSDRVSYIYYMLIVMPGVYIVTVKLFARRQMPTAATIGWAIALIYGFVHLFPIRTLF